MIFDFRYFDAFMIAFQFPFFCDFRLRQRFDVSHLMGTSTLPK